MYQYRVPITDDELYMTTENAFYKMKESESAAKGCHTRLDAKNPEEAKLMISLLDDVSYWRDVFEKAARVTVMFETEYPLPDDTFFVLTPKDLFEKTITVVSPTTDIGLPDSLKVFG